MSERSRLKTSTPINPNTNPKPFDITKYVNPISIGSVISLISLGLYLKYKSDAWEYENLMKAKQCLSIEEAIKMPGQYVNFVCEASADNLYVSSKFIEGKPVHAVIVKKENIRKLRSKNEFAIEDELLEQSILSGPIILTDNNKRIKVESNEYVIDDDKGIQLEQIVYQERQLPKKFRKSFKDPLAGKIFDKEKVLWPGTLLTAYGVIQKIDGKYELIKDTSKPYYLTTQKPNEIISHAKETVHTSLFWSAIGTGGVGLCILTAGIINLYLSK
jgi:hypothetical protein